MEYEHELFLVFAAEDAKFVRGYLLAGLGLSPSRILLVDALPLGGSIVAEIERGVARSRFTLAVLSPAYLVDRWAVFGELLASYLAVDASRVIPLRLASCQLPLRLEARVSLDFTTPDEWDAELARLRDLVQAPALLSVAPPCPYPGMRPFTADEHARFFGRTREIAELVRRLRAGEREIFVIGPSGSGKSSLISAGLIPQLERTAKDFTFRTLRPGEHPAKRLAEACAWQPESVDARLLVYIDQFEEIFTLADADERGQLVSALRQIRADPRCHVVASLRVEFYGALMSSELWPDIEGRFTRLEVAPLRGDALRESIEAPAASVEVYIERALIDRLIADVASEPGALPLLQETLIQLWAGLQHHLLRLVEYEQLGSDGRSGLAVAIALRADATLHGLTSVERSIARRILLRLISFGEGRPDTRRQQVRATLSTSQDDAHVIDRVIRMLVDARMLTVDVTSDGEPLVDLAHEALISGWPELRGWLAARRADEQRRRQLEQRAAEWIHRGGENVGLFDAVELAEAERWIASDEARELGYSDDLTNFVSTSRRMVDVQVGERRRLRRRLTWLALALGSLVTIAGVVVGIAGWRARTQARHELGLVEEEQARSLLVDNHDIVGAIPHLDNARDYGVVGPRIQTLLADVRRWDGWRVVVQHGAKAKGVAASPDSTHMMTMGADQRVRIWNIATGATVGAVIEPGDLRTAMFTSDGAQIVTLGEHGTVGWWDAMTGKPTRTAFRSGDKDTSVTVSPDGKQIVIYSLETGIARILDPDTGATRAVMNHGKLLLHVCFSPDLKRVATTGADGVVRVWDASTGMPLGHLMSHGPASISTLASAVFSPDGSRILTESYGDVVLWDAQSGTALAPPMKIDGFIRIVNWSTDGARIVIASDRDAGIWDAAKEQSIWAFDVGAPPISAAFSPDGTSLLTVGEDGVANLWDASSGKPLRAFKHGSPITSATYTPDGAYVVTGADDGTARVWDVTRPSGLQLRHGSSVSSATFSGDGRRVLTASSDKTAMLWNATTGEPIGAPLEHDGTVFHAAFSRDGTRVVTSSQDRTARVWDATTGRQIGGPFTHDDEFREEDDVRPPSRRGPKVKGVESLKGAVMEAELSPDGNVLLTASTDGTARVWEVATGREIYRLVHDFAVSGASFSPHGERIATRSGEKIYLWNAADGTPIGPSNEGDHPGPKTSGKPLAHNKPINSIEFSPDGSRVVSASGDKTARVWDAAAGTSLGIVLVHDKAVNRAMFDGTGARIVTASEDGTARIWNATSGAILVTLTHPGPVTRATFSFDGTRVMTVGSDGSVRIWDAETGKALGAPLYHDKTVEDASFSPDDTMLVTACDDGLARVWRVSDQTSLAAWEADLRVCIAPVASAGTSQACALADVALRRSQVFQRARATIAVGDAKMFSRTTTLPRAHYEQALDSLSFHDAHPTRVELDEAQRLRSAIEPRIAILDALDGDLGKARKLFAKDNSMSEATLLEALGGVAHDALSNDVLALELLMRAHALEPVNVSILSDLAEVEFTSGGGDLAQTLQEVSGLKPRPELRLVMATIAWASAYAHHDTEKADAARRVVLSEYLQQKPGTPPTWSWAGTKHALAYGRFNRMDAEVILKVIAWIEKPTDVDNESDLARLLDPHPS